ncbi:MRN complex-interacting protein [Zootoca vivipara]|uniref:MRN complex-interacting protein n=1 Tax=Zootoca vivipara TaxID=8524 RepID=UPI00159244A3|nr:MRN complex-interacting protein [Zootoca vivipara]
MAQQCQVLRCCFCNVFQVQQIKKSQKWNCKVCDEKQSVLKSFGQGSGSDCRRHVQKLNLLQGQVEQGPTEMLRSIEEPIKRDGENTIVKLEENSGGQEEKVKLVSRWTKYLNGRCEEQVKEDEEEIMVHTEKQSYSFKNTLRKCQKTSLHISDSQGSRKRRAPGFAKDVLCFENRKDSAYGDDTSLNVIPVVKEHLVCQKNKDSESRAAELSKWEKFLLSGKSCNSGNETAMMQERQGMLVQMFAARRSAERPATSSPCNWHHASVPLAGVQQFSNIEHVPIADIPVGRRKHFPPLTNVHLQEKVLQEKVPEEQSSFVNTLISVSNSKNLHRNLFSTGDDFDDDI